METETQNILKKIDWKLKLKKTENGLKTKNRKTLNKTHLTKTKRHNEKNEIIKLKKEYTMKETKLVTEIDKQKT
jgi:hypothetical protein